MSMHNLHLLIPVLNETVQLHTLAGDLTPSQEHMLAHIDGQVSLAALAVILEQDEENLILDTKQLILHKVIRLCKLPDDASTVLPKVVKQDYNSTADLKIAWTQQQARERRAWSSTERSLLTVAYQQQQRHAKDLNQERRQQIREAHQWLLQEAEHSIEKRGVFDILGPSENLGATIVTPQIKPPRQPLTPQPRVRSSILESLDDLDAWDDEVNEPAPAPALPTGELTPAPFVPGEEPTGSNDYQSLSYYDLMTSTDEPLSPSSQSYPSHQAMPNASQVLASAEISTKPTEHEIPVASTLLNSPPVPPEHRHHHSMDEASIDDTSDSLLELALLGEAPPPGWQPTSHTPAINYTPQSPPSPLPSILNKENKKK